MRPPSRWLAPGAGTAMPPTPPRQSGGGARGPEVPPHSPPPPPTQAQERTEADRRNGGPTPPRRGRCTRDAGAQGPRQAPTRPACCRPTADRRRPGRRKRSGLIRGRPGEDGGMGCFTHTRCTACGALRQARSGIFLLMLRHLDFCGISVKYPRNRHFTSFLGWRRQSSPARRSSRTRIYSSISKDFRQFYYCFIVFRNKRL